MTGTWNQTGLGRHWRQDLFHAVVHALNKDQSKHGVNIRGVNILREMYLAMVSKYTNPQKDEENKKQHAASATFDSNKKQFPLCVVVFLCFILRDGGQVKKTFSCLFFNLLDLGIISDTDEEVVERQGQTVVEHDVSSRADALEDFGLSEKRIGEGGVRKTDRNHESLNNNSFSYSIVSRHSMALHCTQVQVKKTNVPNKLGANRFNSFVLEKLR